MVPGNCSSPRRGGLLMTVSAVRAIHSHALLCFVATQRPAPPDPARLVSISSVLVTHLAHRGAVPQLTATSSRVMRCDGLRRDSPLLKPQRSG